ncbi:NUDIX hydrolase [Microbacterium sp. ET2]|uniref:NUDIX domain-containing protein n=1 Tax=Microbacterium albipurpureum TaxID=3050384 RepID=UPI00259D1B5A|nr:NUDIX hydrolase [Microbacterium sp. ET2 (Ac-2212)]WJL95338.1 NUDIX hydrolase [Microbacterium sp. ET2 (Ac-2212)]
MAEPTTPDRLADEPVTPHVASAERVYTGRVWNVQRDVVRYAGDELVREYVAHPGAAAVVALDAEDRVIVIQQYRHPIRHRDWEIPAGLLDVEGEPPLETAKRELAEEVDLVAERWDPLVSIFTTPGGNDEVVHLFLARGLSSAPEVHARGEEEADIRVEWMALADVVDAVIAGRFRNGILATGALAAAEILRRERSAR